MSEFPTKKWTVVQLRNALKERGLKPGAARKAELIQRLTEVMEEEQNLFQAVALSEGEEEEGQEEEERLVEEELAEEEKALLEDVKKIEELERILAEEDEAEANNNSDAPASNQGRFSVAAALKALLFIGLCGSGVVYYLSQAPKVQACEDVSIASIAASGLADASEKVAGLIQIVHPSFSYSPKMFGEVLSLRESLQKMKACADAIAEEDMRYLYVGYSSVYVFFQILMIPGPNLAMSVLAGALFKPAFVGYAIVAASCTLGAAMCYLVVHLFLGHDAVRNAFPGRIAAFRKRIQANRDSLVNYMLFLRLTPFLPNWFINISSPVVDVPLTTFAIATLLGQLPMNVVYYHAGQEYFKLQDSESADPLKKNMKMVLIVACIGVAALMPTFFQSSIENMEAKMGKVADDKETAPEAAAIENDDSSEDDVDDIRSRIEKRKKKSPSKKQVKKSPKSRKKSPGRSAKYRRSTTLVENIRDRSFAPDEKPVLRPRHRRRR